jgi:uncharacterized LabA/DUF88 family protein
MRYIFEERFPRVINLARGYKGGACGRPFYVQGVETMMRRVGVFVDAGYLFAQGSTCLEGSKAPRTRCQLRENEAIAALIEVTNRQSGGKELLRIYWYDGVGRNGQSLSHQALANLDNVKLRLGFLNDFGQQKGVDSLIVTDLIELARNAGLSDAVVLSGDEDVRVGVQVAQTYGVRVHLLGIHPASGSQSRALRNEADTITEWNRTDIASFLSVVPDPADGGGAAQTVAPSAAPELGALAAEFVRDMQQAHRADLVAHFKTAQTLPKEFDQKLLSLARDRFERFLEEYEKRALRAEVRTVLTQPSP